MASTAVATAQQPTPRGKYRQIAIGLLPWIGYMISAIIMLRNMLPTVTTHLPGRTDGWQNVWNIWWMRFSLLDLHSNPFFSDYIYYPNGTDLLFHTYAPLNGVLALPFTVALGPLITTNLLIIGSFIFTGMAAYALARGLGVNMFGSWLAGAVYAFCNPPRWEYFGGGQADHLAMQWIPLYILCLVKATPPESMREEPDDDSKGNGNGKDITANARLPWKWLVGGALFLAANGVTDWQFFVYMLVFTALYGVFLLFRERAWKDRLLAIRNLAIIGVGTVVILSPILYPTITEALNPAYSLTPPLWQTILHSWDVINYIAPNESNPVWGAWVAQQHFASNRPGNVPGLSNAGYVPFFLAVLGLLAYRRRVYQWAVFGFVFAVLSLGPILHINGVDKFGPGQSEITMPYALLLNLPFFNISRDPSRFAMTAFLCLALLTGFGWMALSRRFRLLSKDGLARYTISALVAVVMLGEFGNISYDITTQPVPEFFKELRKDTRDYALLEVPVADKFYAEYTEALISVHHKRIVGG